MRFWSFILAILLPAPLWAQSADRHINPNCRITPAITTSNYPGFSSVVTGNNLIQPAGKAVAAAGQVVHVVGRVFDRNCVPVNEAKVELWQADGLGRHKYATKASLATPDAIFTGSGRATTDNLGQFRFITLYPGPYQYRVKRDDDSDLLIKRAPYLNVRVTHPNLNAFNSNLFFAGDYRNTTDYRYNRLSRANKRRVQMHIHPIEGDANQGLRATIDIILPQSLAFRKY